MPCPPGLCGSPLHPPAFPPGPLLVTRPGVWLPPSPALQQQLKAVVPVAPEFFTEGAGRTRCSHGTGALRFQPDGTPLLPPRPPVFGSTDLSSRASSSALLGCRRSELPTPPHPAPNQGAQPSLYSPTPVQPWGSGEGGNSGVFHERGSPVLNAGGSSVCMLVWTPCLPAALLPVSGGSGSSSEHRKWPLGVYACVCVHAHSPLPA